MNSMTGYGRASAHEKDTLIEVSIKTVNGRFLDVRPHLPKPYYAIEDKIVKTMKSVFFRGSCDLYIQRVSGDRSTEVQFQFNTGLAEKWLKAYRKSLKTLKIEDTFSAKDVLSIPEFMSFQESQSLSAKETTAVMKALKQAILSCQKERAREGRFLKTTCEKHLKDLESRAQKLKAHRKAFVKEAQKRFQQRLDQLCEEKKWDESRMAQEIALLVDRTDVEEELNRLGEHIKKVKVLFKSSKPVGKKLDFYAQELLREVNTIGSKSQSAKMTEEVVEAKSLVEQLREQIQNIE